MKNIFKHLLNRKLQALLIVSLLIILHPISLTEAQSFVEQTGINLAGVKQSSVAWGDYDNDGDLDILITGSNGKVDISKIYKNNGNNTFTEQTSISLVGVSRGAAAWGDYDNDGDLDILLTGESNYSPISVIYRNNSNNTFSLQSDIILTGVRSSSASWGDYDNDGDLDILISGFSYSGSNYFTKIYRNEKNNKFIEQTNILLTGVFYNSVAWGDYDNDGDLDILISGNTGSPNVSKIYRNNGDNSFSEQTSIVLKGVWFCSLAWGDYDNDGDLDILLTGNAGDISSTAISKIYRNNGNNSFSEQSEIKLIGVSASSAAWGDCDSDGDLDILIAGYAGDTTISKIYRNNGNNSFSEQSGISLPGVSTSSVAWGDYDNDGDLDILLTGSNDSGNISKIFRNEINIANIRPDAPTGLNYIANGADIVLHWNPVKTDLTPTKGMYFNVRVGKSSLKNDVVSSMSDSISGFRRVVTFGNAQLDTTFILRNLKKGTYYWSVQAIDNSFAGGAFATEQSFTINSNFPASSLLFHKTTTSSIKFSWLRGNGDNCAVFVKENGDGIASPNNNTSYTGNKTLGLGTQIGTSGWYCVYNGTLDTATITGLKPLTNYAFYVVDYYGLVGSEQYITVDSPTGHAIISTDLFIEQTNIKLPDSQGSSVDWGDYDNDGDLDILIADWASTKIYRNNGNNSFTEQTGISLKSSFDGTVNWGDYDNDGRLDIIITGNEFSSSFSKIYHNNGNNSFSELTSITVYAVRCSSVAWGDYDNDGDLDFLLTGDSDGTAQHPISRIYRNNGNNSFTEQKNVGLTDVSYGCAKWGDYDNDGDLDILLTGLTSGYESISKIYRNNGNNSFSEQTDISLAGVNRSSVAWGDYDNDGDLDILLTGSFTSKIYRNNGDNSFSEQADISLSGVDRSSVAWGDYDNDGDLDILIAGQTMTGNVTKIYSNNGNNSFSEQNAIKLLRLRDGSLSWGDYDNDGDLDILLNVDGYTKIYRNDILNSNLAPDAPTGLSYTTNGADVVLKWNPVKTDATPAKGMSYNIRVGKSSLRNNVVSSMSDSINGFNYLAAMGNAQLDTNFILRNLKKGIYYWSVQAIDNGFTGGTFASEQSFTIATDMQSSGLSIVPLDTTSGRLSWIRGNGDSCIVLVREGSLVSAMPNNNTTYLGNKTFGLGSQIGSSGWYCVYNGNSDTAIICGLKSNTEYFFKVIEYSGAAGNESYITDSGTTNPISILPSAPTFSINYNTEKTIENVDKTIEYSNNIAMTNLVKGNGAKIVITPGQNLYFRKASTSSSFASAIQTLIVPARPETPSYAIDYLNELTSKSIAVTDEYSTNSNMKDSIVGTNAKISIIPSQNLYFRKASTSNSFASAIQTLLVPARPTTPAYTIDYVNESTSSIISATDEYSINSNMKDSIVGINAKVAITPGQNLYFRKSSTLSSFVSVIQTLIVPARPATPAYTIDYLNESTSIGIAVTDEYSTNSNMKDSKFGTNAKIAITPGQNLYFRKASTSSSFASAIQNLLVLARPETPTYTIDYLNESTSDSIAVADEYSTNSNMKGKIVGTNAKVAITPGQNLYFRKASTSNSFASAIQTLTIPVRPQAPTLPKSSDVDNTFDWTNTDMYINVTDYEYQLCKDSDWTICINKPVLVGNVTIAIGEVKVRVKATISNFVGTELVSTKAYNISTSITNNSVSNIKIYPNPVRDFLYVEDIKDRSLILIYNIQGNLIKEVFVENTKTEIPVSNLLSGFYILKIRNNTKEMQTKFVKQ